MIRNGTNGIRHRAAEQHGQSNYVPPVPVLLCSAINSPVKLAAANLCVRLVRTWLLFFSSENRTEIRKENVSFYLKYLMSVSS